jgi:multiple sugar transport system permease protein
MIKSRKLPIVSYMLLCIIIVWSIFPIAVLIKASFTPSRDIFAFPPKLFTRLTFQNYRALTNEWSKFYVGMFNSILITIGSAAFTIAITLPTAYAFSRFAKTGIIAKSAAMLIIARMFPPIVVTIPLYPVLNAFNLVDNHIVLIVLYTAFYVSLGTLTMKAYFDGVPIELEESALIEGCSKIKAFFIIILPLSTTGIMSVGILVAIFAWKEFLFAFLFTTSYAVTAPVVLNEMLGGMFGVSWGPLFAAAAMHLVPISILIIFAQRYIVDSRMLVRDK